MNKDIKVSIITVCYNSEKTIETTIKSVLNQTYDNIEYIIVDGASTDNTLNIIDAYRNRFDDRLNVISELDNGIYDAMNKGIKLATGTIIGIINSDDYYENDAVENVVKSYTDNHENPLAVYYGKTAGIINGLVQGADALDPENLETDGMAGHPSCFVTKMAYDKIGIFDTQYSCVGDYDLMLRFYRSGKVSFIYINKILAYFRSGGISGSQKAYFDLLDLQVNYGFISRWSAFVLKFKAKVSSFLDRLKK